ncbi:MAG: hypothetical protein BAJATHORv1_20274 [Candidatus Thorarchaeota archaeon]|nr:MAG: hypothetical protein BAJATHORv1_20274 [Candidatus Thorarchaeota archaeon]
MKEFMIVLASGAEHLEKKFRNQGIPVYCLAPNFDGKRFFPNSDLYVKIPKVEELANKRVVVLQNCTGSSPAEREYFSTADRLEELILILDMLKHPLKVVKIGHKEYNTTPISPPSRIEVVLTFQPFALQDKAFSTGEAVSSRSAMRNIASRCDKLWVVEPVVNKDIDWVADLAKQGKYEVISFTSDIVQKAAETFGFEEHILRAPDEGAQKRFGVPGLSKRRSDSFTIEMQGDLDVKGKNVIVIDDLTKSGTTLLRAGKILMEQGAAEVGFVVLHVTPIKQEGEELLADLVEKSEKRVMTSNTVYSKTFCKDNPELVYNVVDCIIENL